LIGAVFRHEQRYWLRFAKTLGGNHVFPLLPEKKTRRYLAPGFGTSGFS
jgi:hypothetical protein